MLRRSVTILGLVVLAVPCVAVVAGGCEPLAIPAQPDASTSQPTGDAAGAIDATTANDLPLPPYAPPNAIKGEIKLALNSTFATWATLGADGKVDSVGWNLPLTAVAALDGAAFDVRTFMTFPAEVRRDTLITSMSYGYLATGHVPQGVYNTPHLDFHIAVQPMEEIMAIDCSDPTLPADELIPPGWGIIPPPDNCFGQMGIHCIFFGAPEFNGERFTSSSVLIFYQGNMSLKGKGAKVSSFEPKFTATFIKERKSFDIPMPVFPPGAVGRPGLQPTKVRAEYNAQHDAYVITANGWVPAS